MGSSNSNSSSRRSRRSVAKRVHAKSDRRDGEASGGEADAVFDPQLEADELVDDVVQLPARTPYASRPAGEQEMLRVELQERLSAYLSKGRPRVVLTDNLHSMVSIKRGDGVVTFRIHHMFVDASAAVLRALGRYAEKQDSEAAAALRAYIDANDERIRRRLSPRPITVDVQGRYHNLQELFDRLNTAYFDGAIGARITWGSRAKRKTSRASIKLGSYTVEDALIRIHPVLDAADVPAYFVEWIVYHEMLHEVHDMPVVDGRRVYHTAEFRRAEAEYERYAEAVMWERTHLAKLLDR